MSDDIVERLREWSTCNVFPEQAQYVISEACLEITALRAEVERLSAALMDIHAHIHLRKYSETREVIDAALEERT